MTIRGRTIFDTYVKNHYNHPTMSGLTVESHAFNVAASAADAHIPIAEVIEEVGPIKAALHAVRGTTQ